jgi:hypothetical protein
MGSSEGRLLNGISTVFHCLYRFRWRSSRLENRGEQKGTEKMPGTVIRGHRANARINGVIKTALRLAHKELR